MNTVAIDPTDTETWYDHRDLNGTRPEGYPNHRNYNVGQSPEIHAWILGCEDAIAAAISATHAAWAEAIEREVGVQVVFLTPAEMGQHARIYNVDWTTDEQDEEVIAWREAIDIVPIAWPALPAELAGLAT